ncbi:hypothetical protein FVE67_08035 [Thermosulfurimonas marina]|uniref:phosphoserine phosphatase n=1 Tax=Thermosulfurimonas marina TaxID=2047767 RepID=A0A6H1WU64_9BACT|nr:hypothetical protein [Thermosulfurimonas marina]QJA06742.1 hypothetical protein FVE67_08035 [Thermosulfurimonas marina]
MPLLALDCEGPVTLNDNAYEFTAALLPQGGEFFARISRYDDYLADVERRPGYKAGDTLKLILPFLKAYGATNRALREFSRKTLRVLPGAAETLKFLNQLLPTFIISTSYRPYLEALGEVSGFPLERVFCTEVDFEAVKIPEAEARLLREWAEKILELPLIEIPEGARGFEDLPPESQRAVEVLEEIFWRKLPEMEAGRFLEEVNPVGGKEKARALETALSETGFSPSEALYIGDSITDVEALELAREGGGGAVAFNANRYALRVAEFYVLSERATPEAELAKAFIEKGKEGLIALARKEAKDYELGLVAEAGKDLVSRSEAFRKGVRGKAIGALG